VLVGGSRHGLTLFLTASRGGFVMLVIPARCACGTWSAGRRLALILASGLQWLCAGVAGDR